MQNFNINWTNENNGFPLNDKEVERYISVKPNENQLRLAQKPFYAFIHFGMNTATAREWGTGKETVDDFTIKSIDAKQWVDVIKSSGATGIILTCKHHDGFCLWKSKYTDFCIKNTEFDGDIVKMLSDECHRQNIDFGVYLSPWDMHDKRYGKPEYNDYFCNQLTELLTNYGEIFEVWFDGAKGKDAVDFEYDWSRCYALIRRLQPKANIAICGPDIRWVGNEGGRTRNAEYSVVPQSLTMCETIAKNSQQSEDDASSLQNITSTDEDLGSRKILEQSTNLCWYPAEVDVSIRKGWFYSWDENFTVKSPKRLFDIYLGSVGNNCTLLLNIPPTKKGVIHKKDAKALNKLGEKIKSITSKPVLVDETLSSDSSRGYLEYDFKETKTLKYIVLQEDIRFSQRVELFDVYLKQNDSSYKHVYNANVIGANKIIKLDNGTCTGAVIVIRQSRSNPVIKSVGFYE